MKKATASKNAVSREFSLFNRSKQETIRSHLPQQLYVLQKSCSFTVKKRGRKNTKKSRCGYRCMGVGLKGLSIMPSASIHRWRDRRSTWDILAVAFTFSCPLCCKHAVWKIKKGKAQVFYINIVIYYKSFKSKVYILRDVPVLLYFKKYLTLWLWL